MPRPKLLSSHPGQAELVETTATLTVRMALGEFASKTGEIISTEKQDGFVIVKLKMKQEKKLTQEPNFTVSFD
jgi:hypothetical protein